MKTVVRMNQNSKSHKKQYKTSTKWWVIAAFVSFTLIAVFIGLVVFLGLTADLDFSVPSAINRQREPDARVVDKIRRIEAVRKSLNHQDDIRIIEDEEKEELEAHVEEVKKELHGDENDVVHPESLIGHETEFIVKQVRDSGFPLFPQPIPETPSSVDEDHLYYNELTNLVDDKTTERSTSTRSERTTSSRPERTSSSTKASRKTEASTMASSASTQSTQTPKFETTKPPRIETLENQMLEDALIELEHWSSKSDKLKRNDKLDEHNISINKFKPMPNIMKPTVNPHGEVIDINAHVLRRLDEDEMLPLPDGPEHRLLDEEGIDLTDEDSFFHSGLSEKYDNEESETADHPFSSYIQGRLQDLYNWIATDSVFSSGNSTVVNAGIAKDLKEVLRAVNSSILEGNSSILLGKLKEMYNNGENDALLNITDPAILANSSSLVSVGLLAFDLLLLHNMQQIAWDEQVEAKDAMIRDPEVVAMNALFLSPEQMRELQEPGSRDGKEDTRKSFFEEFMALLNSTMRAVFTLGRVYRSSMARRIDDVEDADNGMTTIDCIWTLYCRNLDKTAKLHGLYGFLAKMNSVGLRLVMGEFPLEHALDLVVREVVQGTTRINCEKIFPKCSPKKAAEVVMNTIVGVNGRA